MPDEATGRYDDETLHHLQRVELKILEDIDRVCAEHGIAYFLDSGSALGALRHGGFIPWDDDVDVGMLRADYDRFLEVAPAALGEGYCVSEPVSNPRQSALFAKVWLVDTKFYTDETLRAGIAQGIGIDVFPYDALSADAAVAAKQLKACRFWQSVMYVYHSASVAVPHGGALGALERAAVRAAHGVLRLASSHEALLRRFSAAAAKGAENPGDEVFCGSYAQFGSYPASIFLPTRLEPFEGRKLPVPGGAERYLEIMFGDWRQLPPVEQRRQHRPVELDFGPH